MHDSLKTEKGVRRPTNLAFVGAFACLVCACGVRGAGPATPATAAVTTTTNEVAQVYAAGDTIEYRLGQTWFEVTVAKVDGARYYVHRDGHSPSKYLTWDRWAAVGELRPHVTTVEAAPAQAGETKLDGLYLQVETSVFGGRLSISFQHYWFRPDGHIYFGVPPGGLAKPGKFTVLEERDPKNCGTYGVADKKLTLQRNGQKAETFALSEENNGAVLNFNGPALVRVGQFKASQKLEGNYEGGSSAAGGGVFLSASGNFNFHADGSFESGSLVAFDSTGDRTSAGGSSQKADKGSYLLGGNTLQLTYPDGKVVVFTVYPYADDKESPPQHMGINGQMYKLQKAG